MAYTNVEKLDDALAALNGARQAFRPDFCLITKKEGRVDFCFFGYGSREINSATTVTWRAVRTINKALEADPGLKLFEDHKGHWVAVRGFAR
ncbi:hypothetical protein EYF88_13915 [Paracoccus sediminis]|uniref:Uncharacterized protein n=1 Tax=Paracoccus sediminis TaxID=1214787 RepID=A0A238XLU8_9RHOB|nr:hypothetical protein [Paracoccus sediminis]TBN48167.1 hypothetical protein EYF88_13915 [Paracoccus sediminis]SNR59996.1 hypothetical protein SAMN06265378_11118 [Paracoccus sediminis]